MQNNGMAKVKVLPLGACQTLGPITSLHVGGLLTSAYAEAGFNMPPFVCTIRAAQQLLQVLSGKIRLDPDFEAFFIAPGAISASTRPEVALQGNDLAIIEPNYPIDVVADGTVLSQQLLKRHLTDPLSALRPELKRLCFIWKTKGLLQRNEEARASAAAAILRAIPDGMENAAAIRRVVARAYGEFASEAEVESGVSQLREALGIPCIMALYTFRYNNDGVPQSQPAGFRTSVAKIAKRLDLPLLDLAGLVQRVGVHTALRPDQRHFRDEFLPAAGRSVLFFLQKHHVKLGLPAPGAVAAADWKAERRRRLEAARRAEASGLLDMALEHYRVLMDVDASDIGALKGQRRVAQMLGHVDEAYEAAEALAQREPDVPAHALVLAKYARIAKARTCSAGVTPST